MKNLRVIQRSDIEELQKLCESYMEDGYVLAGPVQAFKRASGTIYFIATLTRD